MRFDTLGEHKVKIVFDYENLTDMSNMFANVKMSTIDLSDLNTVNVTNMNSMFINCDYVKDIRINLLDTTNVTDMSYMFANCDNLTNIAINGLNTNKVTMMKGMFSGLPKISKFDLSSFNLLNVVNMENMFANSTALTEVKMMSNLSTELSALDMFKGVETDGLFYYNINYNYARIITVMPKTWTAIES